MAGIVEGDALVQRLLHLQVVRKREGRPATWCSGKSRDVAEARILVLDRVVAVRIGGDDALERLGARHLLDVVAGKFFKQPFFADAAHIVACRLFAFVQKTEIFASCLQQARDRLADLLVARIERRVIADKPECLGSLFADVLDLELQCPGPCARLRSFRQSCCRCRQWSLIVLRSRGSISPCSTSWRRMRTIKDGCSMPTGQISWHAPQLRQAHKCLGRDNTADEIDSCRRAALRFIIVGAQDRG